MRRRGRSLVPQRPVGPARRTRGSRRKPPRLPPSQPPPHTRAAKPTRPTRAWARAVRGPRYPYRVPGHSRLICTRDRSSPLSPVLDDVRSGIRRVSGVGTIARLTPQVVPGIQPLTASPVPKLVPEIQVPLHLPASTLLVFLYFISRHYGISLLLGRQAPGLHWGLIAGNSRDRLIRNPAE